MNAAMIALLLVCTIALLISISFLALPPETLRKLYPGWRWTEALMWKSRFFNVILRHLRGQDKYESDKQEWLESLK